MDKKLNGHPPNGQSAHDSGAHEAHEQEESSGEIDLAPAKPREVPPPPPAIAELAESCVRYVERSLGVNPKTRRLGRWPRGRASIPADAEPTWKPTVDTPPSGRGSLDGKSA